MNPWSAGRVVAPVVSRWGVVAIVGCLLWVVPAHAQETPPEGSARPSVSPDPVFVVTADLPPVAIVPVLDHEAAVTRTLLPDAEVTLSATDAAGTMYELVAPAGAVLGPTDITMTPLDGADGLPFANGVTFGVDLGPPGLTFNLALRLTIRPAGGALPEGLAAWNYLGDGTELALALAEPTDDGLAFEVWHFSGIGGSVATTAELATQVRTRVSDLSRAYQQAIAETLAQDRPDAQQVIDSLVSLWWDQILQPLWSTATTCAGREEALRHTAAADRMSELAGSGGRGFLDRARPLELDARPGCIEEIWRQCEVDHDLFAVTRFLALEREVSLWSLEAFDAQPWVDGCARWEFVMESDATVKGKGVTGGKLTQRNGAASTLEFVGIPRGLSSAPVGPWPMDVAVSGSSIKLTPARGCKAEVTKDAVSDTKLETLAMGSEYRRDQSGNVVGYRITQVLIGFDPGEDQSDATFTCKVGGNSFSQSGMSMKPWNMRWLVHRDEDGEGEGALGFLTIELDVSESGDLFGRKTYDRDAKLKGVPGGSLEEQTVLELWHRPKHPAGS